MRLNDEERRLWVLNDEGLYNWWQSSRLSMRRFIRENRSELDKFIRSAVEGSPPYDHATRTGMYDRY